MGAVSLLRTSPTRVRGALGHDARRLSLLSSIFTQTGAHLHPEFMHADTF